MIECLSCGKTFDESAIHDHVAEHLDIERLANRSGYQTATDFPLQLRRAKVLDK